MLEIMLFPPKNLSKRIHKKKIVQKCLVPSNFVSKNIWSQKNVDRKIIVTKFVYKNGQKSSKKCWLEKFSLKTICFSECWVPKIFCPKTILIQQFFV